jgi:hypothetical protein
MNKEVTQIEECPITHTVDAFTYIDLGEMPLVNNLCNTKEESLNCKKYPLKVQFFPESKLSALTDVVDGELLFSNYLFKSKVNVPYINHCRRMFDYISGLIKLNVGDLIVDIGGNDGTLLAEFKASSNIHLNYLNIDPSKNLAQSSIDKGIPVLTDFFTRETGQSLRGKARIVTSTNVFQHLKDIESFVGGVYDMLAYNGMWILEFPYWLNDLQTNQFDQIYHEHVYYYTVTPLNKLFNRYGFKIIRIEAQNIHGGTLRLVMVKDNSIIDTDASLEKYLKMEEAYNKDYHERWGIQIKNFLCQYKENLKNFKYESLVQDRRIIAFGAAAKGCIFLNAAKIDYKLIDCIVDDTDIKQYKYMPGTGIQILPRTDVDFRKVDYILILTHNFADYIVDNIRNTTTFTGKFITFLPKFKIYE